MRAVAGIARHALEMGDHRLRCHECGRSDRDRTLGVTIEPGRGVAHCYRCGYVETWHDERTACRPGEAPAPPVGAMKRETLSNHARDLWAACRPIAGVARAYLEARACVIPPSDGDLRRHPALRHPVTGHEGPALVALLTDAIDGTPRTLHRTWIRPDGTKAPEADPPRMLLGGHRKAGAVCRLWPDEALTTGLGVAEGIESALSLAHAFTPVWAAIDAGNLAGLPVLPDVEALTIAADNDPAGIEAAARCAARWAGREVRIFKPAQDRADINDLVRAGA